MHCQLFPFAQIDQVQRGLIQSGIAERLTATIYSGVTLGALSFGLSRHRYYDIASDH